MPIPVTVKAVGLSVDLLLWRAYGRKGETSDMLTAALALNPGVSALGAILPLGTSLVLPDLITAAAVAPKRAAVSLFGD